MDPYRRQRWRKIFPFARVVVFMMMSFGACGASVGEGNDFASKRLKMVATQIAERGIKDAAVLAAMRVVPRHEFVPLEAQPAAYEDYPLPIGSEQTISQPYIVAYMTEALKVKKGQTVLEVGTGSGYQAAVLAQMGVKVYSVEIIESLGRQAENTLKRLGYNVEIRIADGYDGWPEHAPFDGIIVTAAPKDVPAPLKDQLKEGGRLVIPVGRLFQDLKVYVKTKNKLVVEDTLPVRFVPMTGKAGK